MFRRPAILVLPALAAALALCVRAPTATAQRAAGPTRVLLLFQQQSETQRMQEFTQHLGVTLRERRSRVEFFQEALDLERFAGRDRSSLNRYFHDKYNGFGIDVVVPIGVLALRFAVDELDDVFPDVPVVFALGVAPQLDTAALPRNVTGRLTDASRFRHTLSMARRLQPDAERVVVVGGAGPIDSISVTAAVRTVSLLRDTLQLTVLQGLPLNALLRELHLIPRRSIVLFANYRQDEHGQAFEPVDIIGTLTRASSAPMYAQLREYVGEGVVGGSVIAMRQEGAATGRLVDRVLQREPGEPMPPVEFLTRAVVADWRQLRRWGLSEKLLPPGAELLFREPSLWQRYRMQVLLAIGVISVQLLLIGSLLVERRRRKRAQKILEEEQRRAEEARLQMAHMGRVALVGELAATISHELRQPLAAILANAEAGAQLLATGSGDRSEAREIFQSIAADDARAVEVIESVRRLLRKGEQSVTAIDLREVCREAVRLIQPDAALRNVRLELSLSPSATTIIGDAVQIRQAILNLLLNALDAAASSTADRLVAIHAESRGDHVEVSVRDSGPGIPPTARPHLFKSLYSTKQAGLGLGLVIVKSIVERHGGQVRAENHESGGAVFTLCLPGISAGTDAPATPGKRFDPGRPAAAATHAVSTS